MGAEEQQAIGDTGVSCPRDIRQRGQSSPLNAGQLNIRTNAFVRQLSVAETVNATGRYLEVSYPASARPGELQMGVT